VNALEAVGLGKAYVPGIWVLRHLELRLEAGSAVAVVGPNGVGKTTLLKVLCGLSEPTTGQVRVMVAGTWYAPRECLWWAIGVAAPYVQLYTEFTPWELLRLGLRLRGRPWLQERIGMLAEELGLSGLLHRRIATLSSGMQQRVRVALALVHEPVVLALDEVTATLDAEGIAAVERLVRQHRERGGIVVAATNAEHERRWCEHVVSLPLTPAR